MVRMSLQELRKIIFNLRPSSLDDLGLQAVTKRLCEEFEDDTGIKTDYRFFGDARRLNSEIEVTLFRVIQEALTNVRKHSMARNCIVKLEYGKDRINLVVADNGIGFDYTEKDYKSDVKHFA